MGKRNQPFSQVAKVIVLSDMGRCRPSFRLSKRYARRRWKVISYETNGVDGKLLLAFDECDAGSVRLPLRVRGRYDVFLGLFPCNWNDTGLCGVRVRLTGEPCFRNLLSLPEKGDKLHEVFWKEADLDGRDIEFAPVGRRGFGDAVSGVAYVKLVPVSKTTPVKRAPLWLGGFIDGDSFIYYDRKRTAADICSVLEPFRGSPFKKIYWGFAVGDTRWYRLHGGTHPQTTVAMGAGYRNRIESARVLQRSRIDVLRVARNYAKSIGLEFHLYHRPGFISSEPPLDEMFSSRFVLDHPEFALRDRDGTRLSQLSYAFRPVQDRMLALFDDHLRYDVDGLNLCFHRGVPMVLFEKPVVDGFRRRHGIDPRTLSDDDPRLIEFRSDIVTGYLKRVRELLNRRGRRLELAVTVLMTKASNRQYGLDLERWVREGVVDVIIPYPETRGQPEKGGIEFNYFAGLTKGTRCQIAPELLDVRSWTTPEKHYADRVQPFYQAGVDGICFWDIEMRTDKVPDWAIIQALARPKSLKRNIALALRRNKRVPLRRLGGVPMDRYPTWWAL